MTDNDVPLMGAICISCERLRDQVQMAREETAVHAQAGEIMGDVLGVLVRRAGGKITVWTKELTDAKEADRQADMEFLEDRIVLTSIVEESDGEC